MLALFATGTVFAWFTVYTRDLVIDGASAGAYFKDGNGTMVDPYSIGNATHMYNFAWLQNTGRIPDKTYFDLDPDKDETVDMTTIDGKHVIIPPIGNDEYPFNGYFDGKGYTISNLIVSTNKDVLYGNPASEDYKFSNAVGLFGMTGNDSEITNFILNDPTVEVANPKESTDGLYKQNTKYNNESGSADLVTGLAIGYVANKASSIGVIGGTLAVRRSDYKTVNSIIGEINPTNIENNNLTGGSGGSGSAFGASFDVENLLSRMEKIYANKNSTTNSWRLPDIDNSNKNPVPVNLAKVPFSVTEESTYAGSDAKEVVADNNIGYFLGNQNKLTTTKELKFGKPMTLNNNTYEVVDGDVPRWFYSYTTESGSYDTMTQNPSYNSNVFKPLSQKEFDALPEGILNLLGDYNTKKRFTAVRLSQTFTNVEHPNYGTGLGGWTHHGQISIAGKTYGKGLMYPNDGNKPVVGNDSTNTYYVVDKNGIATGDMLNQYGGHISFQDYTNGIYLPNSAVWFKPIHTGKIKFVMYAENTGEGFALVKITRNGATAENPFYTDGGTGWEYGNDIDLEPIMRTSLPSGVLLYFEHEVTAADIRANNIEYMIMQYGNNGADFIYLDIGASAEDGSTTEQADPTKLVTAIDFIYGGVSIIQEPLMSDDGTTVIIQKGTFIYGQPLDKNSIYIESGKMLSFGGNGAIVCFYIRNESTDKYTLEAGIWVNNLNDNYLKTNDGNKFETSTRNNITITNDGIVPASG